MGAGKSSVGRVLGQRLNWIFEDLDDRIELREHRRVAEIFRDSGEPAFRRSESLALQQAIEQSRGGVPRIIALGGGAFPQKANLALLKASSAPTVFLKASLRIETGGRTVDEIAANIAQRLGLKSIRIRREEGEVE